MRRTSWGTGGENFGSSAEWWSRQGSNLRHPQCHCGALPTELRPQPAARRLGTELALSKAYFRNKNCRKNGAPWRDGAIRTDSDPLKRPLPLGFQHIPIPTPALLRAAPERLRLTFLLAVQAVHPCHFPCAIQEKRFPGMEPRCPRKNRPRTPEKSRKQSLQFPARSRALADRFPGNRHTCRDPKHPATGFQLSFFDQSNDALARLAVGQTPPELPPHDIRTVMRAELLTRPGNPSKNAAPSFTTGAVQGRAKDLVWLGVSDRTRPLGPVSTPGDWLTALQIAAARNIHLRPRIQ